MKTTGGNPKTAVSDGRRKRSEVTRQNLLEAAARLFADQGYEATTLDELAAAASVNKAMVRYHFGNKQGLYAAVLREAISTGRKLLVPVLASEQSAAERLAAFVDAIGELMTIRPHFAPIVTREWMSGGANMDDDVLEDFLQFYQTDREILEAGVAEGTFRKVDPHAAHLSLIGSLVFFQISQPARDARPRNSPAGLDRVKYLEHVKELFLRGLAL